MLSHLIAITLTVGSQLASDDATAISYLHLFLFASGAGLPCSSSARSSAPHCLHLGFCFHSATT